MPQSVQSWGDRHALVRAIVRSMAVLIVGLGITPFGMNPAQAETEVDLALVLAVDLSRSMDTDEQRLQRDGFVEAFGSQAVHDAIRKGVLGRIVVTYVDWSGASEQSVVVPWTFVDGRKARLPLRSGSHGCRSAVSYPPLSPARSISASDCLGRAGPRRSVGSSISLATVQTMPDGP
jgi:hypothetical protein